MAQKPKSIEECTEETKNPNIPLIENRMKMVFLNRSRKTIKIVKVDGCAITEGIKCDYLVLNDKSDEFFVELKGTDIRHACEQLSVSISRLSENPAQKAKHSFVVCSRVRPAINTTIQILKVQFKRRFNCILIVKNQYCEFEL